MGSSKIVTVLLFVGLVILVIALGPRPHINTSQRPEKKIPDELSALPSWLQEGEDKLGNVTPGAEKHIIWADAEHPQQTDIVVLYLHGFSATRQEISPVSETIAQSLNANIYLARLPGHGRGREAMTNATADDWLDGTWEAWQVASKLGKKVLVMATSTGAPLVTWLLLQPGVQDQTLATVYLSANFAVNNKASFLLAWPWSRYWVPHVMGEEYSWEPKAPMQGKYWTTAYGVQVLIQLQALLNWAQKQPFPDIKVPLLLIHNHKDTVVKAEAADAVFEAWGGFKKHVEVVVKEGTSDHVIAGDIMHPENNQMMIDTVLDFVNSLPMAE